MPSAITSCVIMPSVIMQTVIMLNVVILNVIILNVVMLNATMPSVILMNVMEPIQFCILGEIVKGVMRSRDMEKNMFGCCYIRLWRRMSVCVCVCVCVCVWNRYM
jgi:hypothetical protein